MKFIIDAQLPKSLSDFLKNRGYDSIHTIELAEQNKTQDSTITSIASHENRIVISKDNDFLESFLINGRPES